MSALNEKQWLFASLLATLIYYVKSRGYEVAFGETTRSDEQAIINSLGYEGRTRLCRDLASLDKDFYAPLIKALENNGKAFGIVNSVHGLRLAADLLLFKNGKYLTDTEDYREAGEFWEGLGGCWGGRFNDGNHFSLEHNGVK